MTPALLLSGTVVVLLAAVLTAMVIDRREETRKRTRTEDALKHLFDQEYRGRHGSFASLSGCAAAGRSATDATARTHAATADSSSPLVRNSSSPRKVSGSRGRSSARIVCSNATSPTKRDCRCRRFMRRPSVRSIRSRPIRWIGCRRRWDIRARILTAIRFPIVMA